MSEFNQISHIRETKLGQVVRTNHYVKHVYKTGEQHFERGGRKFNADGTPLQASAATLPKAPEEKTAPSAPPQPVAEAPTPEAPAAPTPEAPASEAPVPEAPAAPTPEADVPPPEAPAPEAPAKTNAEIETEVKAEMEQEAAAGK